MRGNWAHCAALTLIPPVVVFAFIIVVHSGSKVTDDSRAVLQAPTTGHPLRLESLGAAEQSARVGDKACANGLLSAERAARGAGRGLWADPNFAPLSAENLIRPQTVRGQFALVEGKVLSIRESGATIYVKFGRRWTRDFTVIILRRLGKAFTTARVEPKKLEGRRIRVRGWIEKRGGPIITAEVPEQIEVLD